MSVARRAYDAVRLWQPPSWTGRRRAASSSSACTAAAPPPPPASSTCWPCHLRTGEMVRGPWNPSGHFESRALMHLNNALLRRWSYVVYPPPAGEQTTRPWRRASPSHAPKPPAFRRVHRTVPWCGRTRAPRSCSRTGARSWATGSRRWWSFATPSSGCVHAASPRGARLVRRGVVERYNRLILLHSADSRSSSPATTTSSTTRRLVRRRRTFLAGLGMRLDDTRGHWSRPGTSSTPTCGTARTRALMSSTPGRRRCGLRRTGGCHGAERVVPVAAAAARAQCRGDRARHGGPDTELAWHPPPWAPEHDGTSQRGPKAAHEK